MPRSLLNPETNIVLASQSPQRLELLSRIVLRERIRVLPPEDEAEAGFSGLTEEATILRRLAEIARGKCDDVLRQLDRLRSDADDRAVAVIAADTTIIGQDADGRCIALEKPPDDETYAETVRDWFHRYYLGRTHIAATAVCIATPAGSRREETVCTRIEFAADSQRWVDAYIAGGEPRGKAGGYGIQSAGSLFVSRIDGSLSNVIGLPLAETLTMLEQIQNGKPSPHEC